ncbi:MAG: type II secretion system F family protein, partial [Lentisphaeria bacterium]|nr:type II secretion system F family protein [Lentisphaeria bacterium]
MSTDYLITCALIFSSVFCFVVFAGLMISSRNLPRYKNVPVFFIVFQGMIKFFANEVGTVICARFKGKNQNLAKALRQAALPLGLPDIYGASVAAILVFAVIGSLIISFLPCTAMMKLLLIAASGLLGMFYPFLAVQHLADKRAEEILRSLPFAIDIISSSMSAGLDFNASIGHLTEIKMGNPVLRNEFMIYLKEVRLGKSRAEALRDMEKRISVNEFSRFIFAVLHGIETGVSIVEVMKIQASELRRIRSSSAEQSAAKAPSKMIIPMVIFIFPSMFVAVQGFVDAIATDLVARVLND